VIAALLHARDVGRVRRIDAARCASRAAPAPCQPNRCLVRLHGAARRELALALHSRRAQLRERPPAKTCDVRSCSQPATRVSCCAVVELAQQLESGSRVAYLKGQRVDDRRSRSPAERARCARGRRAWRIREPSRP